MGSIMHMGHMVEVRAARPPPPPLLANCAGASAAGAGRHSRSRPHTPCLCKPARHLSSYLLASARPSRLPPCPPLQLEYSPVSCPAMAAGMLADFLELLRAQIPVAPNGQALGRCAGDAPPHAQHHPSPCRHAVRFLPLGVAITGWLARRRTAALSAARTSPSGTSSFRPPSHTSTQR